MIIGAQKAGTSSLKNYLGEHPDIYMHEAHECTFFLDDSLYNMGFDAARTRFYFEDSRFKSSPIIAGKYVSILTSEKAIKRLKDHNPEVKIVIILRNPITRAYSAFWYAKRMGVEYEEQFEKALKLPLSRFNNDEKSIRHCDYIGNGLYDVHLKKVFSHFPKEQIKIFLTEDLKTDPGDVCKKIFRFCKVDESFTPTLETRHNVAAVPKSVSFTRLLFSKNPLKQSIRKIIGSKTAYSIKERLLKFNEKSFVPPPLAPETYNDLVKIFEEHNKALGELIHRDLSSWNKLK